MAGGYRPGRRLQEPAAIPPLSIVTVQRSVLITAVLVEVILHVMPFHLAHVTTLTLFTRTAVCELGWRRAVVVSRWPATTRRRLIVAQREPAVVQRAACFGHQTRNTP